MKSLLALVAGVLYTLAFAPFDWWPLLVLSFAVLFVLWLQATPLQAAWYGFVFGLGLFGSGISWMYISLHVFGNMPVPLAALSIFVLVIIMSLYPALSGLLQAWFSGRTLLLRLALIMPFCWLLMEWLRGWLLTGLPWLTAGYALLDTTAAGFAPIGGVYALSLIALITAGVLLGILMHTSRLSLLFLVLTAVIWLAGWRLLELQWSEPSGEPFRVAVIQNNVALSQKWEKQAAAGILQQYQSASDQLSDHDLIVWPEGAVPKYLDQLDSVFWDKLRRNGVDFVFGVSERIRQTDRWVYHNSVVAYTGGNQVEVYRKQHLVPFGEFFPLKFILMPLLRYLDMPMSDFSPWQIPQQPLSLAGTKAALSICFEDAFPNETRSQVEAAGILLNVSEDAWFGDSTAPHQRLQMARFRSLESGRPMIRSSNSGLSSLIDTNGVVKQIAPQFKRAVVSGRVQPYSGVTPYIRYGDYPALLLAFVLLLIATVFGTRNKKQ